MSSPVVRFMKRQGWKPVKGVHDDATCATCENQLDTGLVKFTRLGVEYLRNSGPFYCCEECALELYEEEGDGDEE